MNSEFLGILILDKKDRPPSQTLAALRRAGYIVLFLDNVDHYRIQNHIALDIDANAKLLLKAFADANGSDYKNTILGRVGALLSREVGDAVKS